MLELTDADRAALRDRFPDVQPGSLIWAAVQDGYRAGLAAGIERAAKACDTAERPKDTMGERWACQRCADAIRALLK
jgi:hypothetical protein